MRLPRDLSGEELAHRLSELGYEVTRQSGSHMRLTTQMDGEHHLTIPRHDPLKVGTLNSLLHALTEHHRIKRDDLLRLISG